MTFLNTGSVIEQHAAPALRHRKAMPARPAIDVLRSVTGLAFQAHHAAFGPHLAEQRSRQFDLAAAHEAVEAEDFAAARRQRNVPIGAPRSVRRSVSSTTGRFGLSLSSDVADVALVQLARGRADHLLDDPSACRARAVAWLRSFGRYGRPSRRREMFSTSSMKCEMKTMLRPDSRSRRSTPNSRSTSGGESAEVGSSRMMMRAPENRTRLISTSCWMPIGNEPIAGARIDVDAEAAQVFVAPRGTSGANRRRRAAPSAAGREGRSPPPSGRGRC